MPSGQLICDGCGQPADQQHITRRLRRLELLTRYRPIHVQAVFLGAVSPTGDADYLYSAETEFRGEGLALLRALGIEPNGKLVESVLADFQRRGYVLTHILECPVAKSESGEGATGAAMQRQLAAALTRIRRSLKPKRVVLLGGELDGFSEHLKKELPEVEIVAAESGRAFRLGELAAGDLVTEVTASQSAGV